MSTSESVFNQGLVVNINEHRKNPPTADAPPIDHVMYHWPIYMVDHGTAVKLNDGNYSIPRLVNWSRQGMTETFVVDFRGSNSHPDEWRNVGQALAGALSCPIPKFEMLSDTLAQFVFSHYKLEEKVPWDGPLNHGDFDLLKFGMSTVGDDIGWNMKRVPHGMLAGLTGSGKTMGLKLAIGQLLALGDDARPWTQFEVLFMSPTTKDSTVDAFRGHPRFTDICGSDQETLKRMASVFYRVAFDMHSERTEETNDAKQACRAKRDFQEMDVWGTETDHHQWDGRKVVVVMDEVDSLIGGTGYKEEDPETMLRACCLKLVAEGRKARLHALFASQSMYASTFGSRGGKVRTNLGFAVGYWKCNEKTSDLICGEGSPHSKLLQEGLKCPGRALAAGADQPMIEFQGYYLGDEQLWYAFQGEDPDINWEPDTEESDTVTLGADNTVGSTFDMLAKQVDANQAPADMGRPNVIRSEATERAEQTQLIAVYAGAACLPLIVGLGLLVHWYLFVYFAQVALVGYLTRLVLTRLKAGA